MDTWMGDLPAMWNYRPPMPCKVQLLDDEGNKVVPTAFSHRKDKLNHRGCDFLTLCWSNVTWDGAPRQVEKRPYLCRDRYWVVAGKSQILPPGFSQEITTTVTRGVEKTECDDWAVALTVEGEVTNGFATLKTTIEASYSKSVTETVYEENTVETRYTPEPVPAGKQAVYQVWVLVDRYMLSDKNGKPYSDPNYRLGVTKRVHVQGVWEAHAITYFPAGALVSAAAAD
jgi:hypothetical protein